MYRLFRNQEKFVVKLVHMTIQSVAVIYTVLGVMAVFDFHNKSKIPNAYSLHSWLGLGAVCLFCCQVRSLIQLSNDILCVCILESVISKFCALNL